MHSMGKISSHQTRNKLASSFNQTSSQHLELLQLREVVLSIFNSKTLVHGFAYVNNVHNITICIPYNLNGCYGKMCNAKKKSHNMDAVCYPVTLDPSFIDS